MTFTASTEVLWATGSIWGLLAIASLLVFALCWIKPDKDFSELVQRTKSWWVMICIFSVALLTGQNLSVWLFGFISFVALKEYLSMIPTRRADRSILIWAYLCIPLQYWFVHEEWYGMFIIFVPVYMFLFLPARMLISTEPKGFITASGTLHWGLMISVFNISHAAYLYTLPEHEQGGSGVGLLLFLVFMTQFNDVMQYVWGKLLGKRKILPKISPGKTWAGFLGGLASVCVASYFVAPWLTPYSGEWALLAGFLIALSGFFGDLNISALKRDMGVKDSSMLIPGHGGILDRVDSLTFSAPIFFHLTWYLWY